ncbi:hypothetical protein CPB86DRAFT_20139 [Serendipita vermifera]|nr:hypothetical protein CPB86DRAFT_20139 [Serendipita vermifera]
MNSRDDENEGTIGLVRYLDLAPWYSTILFWYGWWCKLLRKQQRWILSTTSCRSFMPLRWMTASLSMLTRYPTIWPIGLLEARYVWGTYDPAKKKFGRRSNRPPSCKQHVGFILEMLLTL